MQTSVGLAHPCLRALTLFVCALVSSCVLMPLCAPLFCHAAVYPINMNEPHINLYTPKIIGANISLFYYSGFCYMMMRRCDECVYAYAYALCV